jgi:hypothetical protein
MKRKDIKAGVVYALKAHGSPKPVVFLEDGAATLWEKMRHGGGYRELSESLYKPRVGHGWDGTDRGFAIISGDAEALAGIDAAAEFARFRAGERPTDTELRFSLVTVLGQVIGPYGEAVAAYEQEQAQQREEMRRRHREIDAALLRLRAITEAFGEFGIRAGSGGSDRVSISIEDAERVIALLRAKTED